MLHRPSQCLIWVFVLVLFAFTPALPAAEIEAGIANVDITPPIGGRTTGYSNSPPTDGVHDRISARILYLKSGQTNLALVVMDLCIFNSPLLHEQVAELGVDQLLLMNTHTHSGPNLREQNFPSADKPWQATIEERVLTGIVEAQQNLFPAYFSVAEGDIQLGYNRLVQDGKFAVTHFENPERIPYGEVDPTVGLIRITDDESTVRALLVHYACHPVVLGPRNRKLSADYPGVMRRIVEDDLGDDATCFFIQGCAGDVNPLFMARGDDREGDFELVERMGQTLAKEVLDVYKKLEPQSGVSEQLLTSSSTLGVQGRWSEEEPLQLGVTTILINDDIAVITLPGEPFHKFQVDFRTSAGVAHPFVFGYCCNGPYRWPSYIPDVASAARGGYGASDTTRAAVGSGERLVNQGLVQLFQLQGRLKSEPQRHTFD